jgi:hypothetical protein
MAFLGVLVLAFSAVWQHLHRAQWTVVGVYLLYLLPYVGVSYYDRYALPLLGVKVLLVIWAADRLLSLRGGGKTKSEQKGVAVPRMHRKTRTLAGASG